MSKSPKKRIVWWMTPRGRDFMLATALIVSGFAVFLFAFHALGEEITAVEFHDVGDLGKFTTYKPVMLGTGVVARDVDGELHAECEPRGDEVKKLRATIAELAVDFVDDVGLVPTGRFAHLDF